MSDYNPANYDHSLKVPLIRIESGICRKCKGNVKPSVVENFYECPTCKSITSDVIISVRDHAFTVKLVVS